MHGDISPSGKLLNETVHEPIAGDALNELIKLQRVYDAHLSFRKQVKKGTYVYTANKPYECIE